MKPNSKPGKKERKQPKRISYGMIMRMHLRWFAEEGLKRGTLPSIEYKKCLEFIFWLEDEMQ